MIVNQLREGTEIVASQDFIDRCRDCTGKNGQVLIFKGIGYDSYDDDGEPDGDFGVWVQDTEKNRGCHIGMDDFKAGYELKQI